MALYASLASRYDELFPPSPKAAVFLDSLVARPGPKPRPKPASPASEPRALDIGCATGSHALGLADLGWTVLGVDSEEAMIARARERARLAGRSDRATFLRADALALGDVLAPRLEGSGFDLVLCLGNTLPHFRGDAAAAFLAEARSFLAPAGKLVVQSVNYALPGIGPGYSFPPLAVGGLSMRRRYEPPPPGAPGTLRFVVELEDEAGTEADEALLEPRSPELLSSLLLEAGFSAPRLFSGWEGSPFVILRDPYLILVGGADRDDR